MIPAGTRLGRYDIVGRVGAGGMGEVYRARDESLQRFVAVKILPPELVGDAGRIARFQQEARAASALNHPGIIHIYEIGEASLDNQPLHYIAMELVEGSTLRTKFAEKPPLPRILGWLAQVAEALAKAHQAGIVHRDLKPENVMVTNDGFAKILDFGLAKLIEQRISVDQDSPTARFMTSAGAIVGTPAYMSPEQIEGGALDHRSDIFSLGCILAEAVSGVHPYRRASAVDTMHRILHDEPDVPDAAFPIQHVIRKCLARDPEQRYQSTRDLAVDLRAAERGGQPAPAVIRHRRWPVIVVSLLIVALVAVSAVMFRRRTPADGIQPAVASDRLTFSGDVGEAAVSPDGKLLAYVQNRGGETFISLRQRSTTSDVVLVKPSKEALSGVTFSPDGSYLYFLQADPKTAGLSHLKRIATVGGTPALLVSNVDGPPTFAPDGRMAFQRSDTIVVADAAGGNERVLVAQKSSGFREPQWSPDGRTIASLSFSPVSGNRITLIDPQTGAMRPVGEAQPMHSIAWLPDGKQIAFVRVSGLAQNDIEVMDVATGRSRRLIRDGRNHKRLTVTADGKEIVTGAGESNSCLWTLKIGDASSLRQIGSDACHYWQVAFGAGGQILYTFRRGDSVELWRADADGSNATRLHDVTYDGRSFFLAYNLSPSPVDDRVAFVHPLEHRTYLLDPATGAAAALRGVDSVSRLKWSADGTEVYFRRERPLGWTFRSEGLFVANLISGATRELRLDGDVIGVSPDSLYVLRQHELVEQTMDGSTRSSTPLPPVCRGPYKVLPPRRSVACLGQDGNVWRMNLTTRGAEPLTNFTEDPVSSFDISNDGRLLMTRWNSTASDAFAVRLGDGASSSK